MDQYIYPEDVPRDIRNIVTEYVGGSRPLYREWANILYINYLKPLLGEKSNLLDENKTIEWIVENFAKNYGNTIGEAIETTTSKSKNLVIKTYNFMNNIESIFQIKNMTSDKSNAIFRFLLSLWNPYHSEFFKYIFETDNIYIFPEIEYYGFSKTYKNIAKALSQGIDPLEIDPFNGKSFFTWIFDQELEFEDEEERSNFEKLMLEMINDLKYKINKKDYEEFVNTVLKIFGHWDVDESLVGWSDDFLLKILDILNINNLSDRLKWNLLHYVAFGDNNMRKILLDEILKLDPNFDFNVIIDGFNILFDDYVVRDPHIIKDYINYGADPLHQNKQELTPLAYFRLKEEWPIVRVLEKILKELKYFP